MKCSNYWNLRCQKTDTDTDTGTLSRIVPGKQYTLRVNWPGFKGLSQFLIGIITIRQSDKKQTVIFQIPNYFHVFPW